MSRQESLISSLQTRAKTWSKTASTSRIALARECLQAVESDTWSQAGNWLGKSAIFEKVPQNKRLDIGSSLRFVTGTTVKSFLHCFISANSACSSFVPNAPVSMGPSAPGCTFELVAEEGTKAADAAITEESIRATPGSVCVVLGVGNQPFLTLTDTLMRVFHYGETVLIKQHPIRTYLEPLYKALLAPLIVEDIVHLIKDEGIPATISILKDPRVGHVHMTGAENTAIAIEKTLALNPMKPGLTSELGCSTPWILAPYTYTKKELQNAARTAVYQKKLNGGSNCLNLQVLVIGSEWEQKAEFLEEIKRFCKETETDVCYYPGVEKTYNQMKAHYGNKGKILLDGPTKDDVTIVDCGTYGTPTFDNYATKNEAFCPILAYVEIEGDLSSMVDFCNSDDLCGSLSCTLLSPSSADAAKVEAALRSLQFGTVAHNITNLIGYTTIGLGGMWGAYPGEPRSGIGIVGNLYGVKGASKQILRSSGLEKMAVDLSKGIPPVLFDVLHKALNVGGGSFGAFGTMGKIWWMLVRRSVHFIAVKARVVSDKTRIPGSAITN